VTFSPDHIFISYARSDGRAFAEAFEERLVAEAGIKSWRDLESIEGGEDILPQVLRAIEDAKHLVLILTPRALRSDWVKREWTHARMVGRKVSPVLADPTLKPDDLPGWIRRTDVYDISEPERWTRLVRVLEGPGDTRHVPYMSGDLPEDFVPRPIEYAALKQAVLTTQSGTAVGITTALRGAGGYGKTVLANALCHDPEVRFEFSDGILRVEIGKERDDVTGLVVDLIEKLDPEGKRPGFQDVVTASEHLAELIGEARLLIAIDDVWREAQLRPFLRGGKNCVRLVTTRLPQVLPRSAVPIPIDEMRAAEAADLIRAGLPYVGNLVARRSLAALADRLGNWAQMLSIANGWIRSRVQQGEALEEAVARFEKRLTKHGLTAFDSKDEKDRNRAIRACVEASLEDLGADELARFRELAILPEDEDVPLEVVAALWAETGSLDEDQAEDLVQRLNALSLLQNVDLGARTLRLHDNMIWYLRDSIGADGCRAAHAAMVRAIGSGSKNDWAQLPTGQAYGWRFLILHLRGAGQDAEADKLLTDYAWIKAKLAASGPRGLYESYLPESVDDGAQLIGRAIALSLPALAANPRELPRQIYGRLGNAGHESIKAIVAAAKEDPNFWPAPRWPGLTPPGAEQLRLVGHTWAVRSAVFSPDGTRVLTTSYDKTARLWDASTGQEIAILQDPWHYVNSAAFSPDGARIVTASIDSTARLWDAATGQEVAALRGHESCVTSAAFSPDGAQIVTASTDNTARLWDAATGQEIIILRGHEEIVRSAAFSPDGSRIVTASNDNTARLWDTATGQEIATLRGHESGVSRAAFSPDGSRIVTASDDYTARLWDTPTGQEIAALRGHESRVTSAAFSPDGARIATASDDGTARLWDAATEQEIIILRGHEESVRSAAFSPDGAQIVTASDDYTARLWDTATGQEIAALRGHESCVRSAAFSPDGARIVTASTDSIARIWDAMTGQEVVAQRRREGWVYSAAFSPDGAQIVTASFDKTAWIWDAATGEEIAALRGHESDVYCATFSPDGTRILTASKDGTARLWDAATGQEVVTLRGHKSAVESAAFSPDGAWIVTASNDNTARLWDAATGQEIAALRGHVKPVTGADFSPYGAQIVTASRDSTARVWDVETATEIARICLDAAVTALAVHGETIALWDALGGIHVFDLERPER
jgi:WD40 repeat protein